MIFYFFISLLIPVITIILGLKWRKDPPKSMNYFYGFRTERSMKNKDTWRYAHLHQSKLLLISGFITIGVIILLMFLLKGNLKGYIIYIEVAEILVQILLIPLTERELKKTFTKSGKRINKENNKYNKKSS